MKKIVSTIVLITLCLNLAFSSRIDSGYQNTLQLKAGVNPFEVIQDLETKGYDLEMDEGIKEYVKENVLEYLSKKRSWRK